MKFKVADSADDYMDCQALLQHEGSFPMQKLEYPTIMAFNDKDDLVGFLSTELQDDLIIAGPLVLKQDRTRPFTALSLITIYEAALKSMGISRFIFYVDTALTKGYARGIEKYFPDMTPYAEQGTKKFYVRVIGESKPPSPKEHRKAH